jgi:NAD(P)-dependent dehydrogenase (short-subunit alcohol dehydrogenase family)
MSTDSTFGDFPLKGKIAVVTGGGSGINLSFVKLAVEEGARVIVADLKLTEDGERFMNGQGKQSTIFTKCDVTKRAELENLMAVSEKEFGDVPDVYIPGAGVFEPVRIAECSNCCRTDLSRLGQTSGTIRKRITILRLTSTLLTR